MKRLALGVVLTSGLLWIWPFPVHAEVLCPITNQPYTAQLQSLRMTAVTGEAVYAHVLLDPKEPPAGYSVSTLVDVVQAPSGAKPAIVTGFPRIKLTFSEPGEYLLSVQVTLITKSSCGGVEADWLLEEELGVTVSAPAAQE